MIPHCPPQQPAEPLPEYAARVLRYALHYGPEHLMLSQLDIADAQAARHVAALPASLDHGSTVLDTCLHTLRLRMQRQMALRRAQLTTLQRLIDQTTQNPPDHETPHSGPDMVEPESDAARAARLLRAALLLIMGPQPPSSNGGGRPARLQPRPPGKPGPPGGIHADDRPTLPPRDGVNF